MVAKLKQPCGHHQVALEGHKCQMLRYNVHWSSTGFLQFWLGKLAKGGVLQACRSSF